MADKKPTAQGECVADLKTAVGSLMKYVCMRINCRHQNDEFDASASPKDRKGSLRHQRPLERSRRRGITTGISSSPSTSPTNGSIGTMDSSRRHCVLTLNKQTNYFSLDLSRHDSMPSTESMYLVLLLL